MDAFTYLKSGKRINAMRLSQMEPFNSEHLGQGDRLSELPLLDSGCPSTAWATAGQWQQAREASWGATPIR